MALTIGRGINIGGGITFAPVYNLVTSGLLLNFDAATYSGSGNWIDGVSGVNAVPSNSPAWSSNNGGTFVLTSSPATYFTVPWPTFQPTYTIDIWFNFTASQVGGAPCLISDDFSGPFNFTINASANYLLTGWYTTNWNGQYATNNVPIPLSHDGSTWYNITMAVGASEYKDYINGVATYAPGNFGPGGSAPNGSGSLQQFYIGKRWDGTETVNAKMAVVNVYDRALTDAEALQNFNHYKSRFA
jgi:Concanavalin A-like lectin/glucanases superfamily